MLGWKAPPQALGRSGASFTALFADLSASTALGERLRPEELKLIVADAVARMIGVIESFDGTVKDLAGDGVLALFGAPVAHEDDPERAVPRGPPHRGGDRRLRPRGGARPGASRASTFRVGVDTGRSSPARSAPAVRVEYTALGDAVNTARRSQSHAEPGSVLVGPESHTLTRSSFEWSDPEALTLKGKAQPVSARRAISTSASSALPQAWRARWSMLGPRPGAGDARELVDSVLEGSGGVLYLVGEPGIGKTRLLSEIRKAFERSKPEHVARSGSRGAASPTASRCRTGRSGPASLVARRRGGRPGAPVRVALRRHVERLFGDSALDVYPYLGSLLGLALEPDAAARLAELSPEALQYRTFEVVRSVLRRSREDGRSRSRSRTSTGPMRRRSSCSSAPRGHGVLRAAVVLTTAAGARPRLWRVKEAIARAPHRDARARSGARSPATLAGAPPRADRAGTLPA
jgi:class 3 adenylate cyclase